MNLLVDNWIPVRPQGNGGTQQISLKTLLCEADHWELSLPRDDMELATVQLLISMAQVLFPPVNKKEWAQRIVKPLPTQIFETSIKDYSEWFQLDHPEYPFMQMLHPKKKAKTPMDKLFTGLDTSTNSRFVNEPDLANGVCEGCTAIALFNYASNSPSFGGGPDGGFKYGVRGTCAVSTFSQLTDLRSTIWVNVLSDEFLGKNWVSTDTSKEPTWVKHIPEKGKIPAESISLFRGLFWQPGCLILGEPVTSGNCACCGNSVTKRYDHFLKAPYGFEITGFWEHPHSPQILTTKSKKTGNESNFEYMKWLHASPAWTQLSGYIVARENEINRTTKQEQRPALVIQQLKQYTKNKPQQLQMLVGGYRNASARIIERKHSSITLNKGWELHSNVVHELVEHALAYRKVLFSSLLMCGSGMKKSKQKQKLKNTGLELQTVGESQFFRRSENVLIKTLANIDFKNTAPAYIELDNQLKKICEAIFDELTSPYQHDLELFRTLTIARRSLHKHIKEIQIPLPEKDAA